MAATESSSSSPMCNLAILDSLEEISIREMTDSWNAFCLATEKLHGGDSDLSFTSDFALHVRNLCSRGLESLVVEHFLCSMEDIFEKNGASRFWKHFDAYSNSAVLDMENSDKKGEIQDVLQKALEEISFERQYQEKSLLMLAKALEMSRESKPQEKTYSDTEQKYLFSKYQLTVSSVLMASFPRHFPDVLHWYFKGRLEELSAMVAASSEYDNDLYIDDGMDLDCRTGEMDVNGNTILGNSELIRNIGEIVRDLRSLGFTSIAEDAYASAIFLLLKV